MAEQVRLSAVLADIAALYATLKEKLDKDSVKAFRDRMIDLRKLIDESLKTLGVLNDSDVGPWAAGDKPTKLAKLKNLDDKIGIEESVQLADFFGNVSSAVIAAQKDLNTFSKVYVEDVEKNHPRIPPTYFAIPSIKAEMKIGFSEMSTRGINVILFKSEKQRNDYGESTVTFELVSAPPLPAPPPKPGTGGPALPQTDGQISPHDMLVADDETPLSLEGLESVGVFSPTAIFSEDETRGEEDVSDVQESLSLARDTLLAAANRLVEAKLGLIEEPELPLLEAEERNVVLDAIVRELESKGEKLEKEFESARKQAVVLKSSKRGRDRYLVLWPGRLESKPSDSWHELRIYELSGAKEDLSIATDIFSRPPEEKHLAIKPRRQLLRLKKEEMADLATNLGDVLMSVITILQKWHDDAKRER